MKVADERGVCSRAGLHLSSLMWAEREATVGCAAGNRVAGPAALRCSVEKRRMSLYITHAACWSCSCRNAPGNESVSVEVVRGACPALSPPPVAHATMCWTDMSKGEHY